MSIGESSENYLETMGNKDYKNVSLMFNVYENTEKLDYSRFFDYVREMCEHMDIPTPVIIKTHLFNYAKFNTVSFSSQDFMEKPDFDKLVLENALL